jgi:hypothetical protein
MAKIVVVVLFVAYRKERKKTIVEPVNKLSVKIKG